MKTTKILFLSLYGGILLFACRESKYAQANKYYKDHLKSLTETIAKVPETAAVAPSKKTVHQQGVELPQEWVGTVNFNLRKPNFVVLHYTAQDSVEQTIKTFTNQNTQVSAHYVLGKDGKVIQMLNDYLRAWHAGSGKWGSETDLNSSSIGIEIDNNGKEPFTEVQIQSLITLLDTLKNRYKIPQANFIGHSDLAPGRKVDPGKYFPWKRLSENGFGFWYDESLLSNTFVPQNFEPKTALRIIGYDIRNYDVAVRSFKLHFFPEDARNTAELDARQCALLYQLYVKYL